MRSWKEIHRGFMLIAMFFTFLSQAQEQEARMALGLTGGISADGAGGKLSFDFGNHNGFFQVNTLLLFGNQESNADFEVTYDVYTINAGYYPMVYQTQNNHFRTYVGIGGSLGFENLRNDTLELRNEEVLEPDAVVLSGTFAGVDIEAQLATNLMLSGQGNVLYYFNTNLKNVFVYAGIGLRYYFPYTKGE